MEDNVCYFFVKGHEREQGSEISHYIAKRLEGYFTGDIYYGYNPDTIKVCFLPTMPSTLADKLLTEVEEKVQEIAGKSLEVSIEIP